MRLKIKKRIQRAEHRALLVHLDPDLAKRMERYINRSKGLTWRAYIEAMFKRFLKEEEGI